MYVQDDDESDVDTSKYDLGASDEEEEEEVKKEETKKHFDRYV